MPEPTAKVTPETVLALLNETQNTFDTFRVIIQYLMFDLEATRRENQQLRDELFLQDGD